MPASAKGDDIEEITPIWFKSKLPSILKHRQMRSLWYCEGIESIRHTIVSSLSVLVMETSDSFNAQSGKMSQHYMSPSVGIVNALWWLSYSAAELQSNVTLAEKHTYKLLQCRYIFAYQGIRQSVSREPADQKTGGAKEKRGAAHLSGILLIWSSSYWKLIFW